MTVGRVESVVKYVKVVTVMTVLESLKVPTFPLAESEGQNGSPKRINFAKNLHTILLLVQVINLFT